MVFSSFGGTIFGAGQVVSMQERERRGATEDDKEGDSIGGASAHGFKESMINRKRERRGEL